MVDSLTICKYNAFILNPQFVLCKMLPLGGAKLRIIPLCKIYRSATLYYVFSLFFYYKNIFDSKQSSI